MTKHIHAELLTEYARISHATNEPWTHFQTRRLGDKEWHNCRGPVEFWFDQEYRLKPKTIRIGGFDVPEPERIPLETGTDYYHVGSSALYLGGAVLSHWENSGIDNARLYAGLIHLDCKSAELHAKALISLTQK
ncbi:hypothetical protein [Xenorhabdus cabanillasii]|uniref:hypothetical protein n=1 Tax=Xenorhabdus cabanillasii TaxID=351673 RepID=UPI0011460C91|nr:hypothetical protein [Xenorhabdus cabanillasii]